MLSLRLKKSACGVLRLHCSTVFHRQLFEPSEVVIEFSNAVTFFFMTAPDKRSPLAILCFIISEMKYCLKLYVTSRVSMRDLVNSCYIGQQKEPLSGL